MMKGRKSAIVWDLDGTLVDSAPDLATALNELLAEHDQPAVRTAVVRTMIGNGVAKLIERGFAAFGHSVKDAQLTRLVSRFMTLYNACATDRTRPYPGAVDALNQFRDAGLRQAICTNKPEAVSQQILNDLQLADFFEIVVGGDTLPSRKPDPLPLQTCIDALDASVDDSLLIGDSAVDVATAKAINMQVGIVTHGYAREPLETLGADFLIDDLSLLPASVLTETSSKAASQ